MNKEELENAFNETTDNAVKLLKENVELKKKIYKAIEYIEDDRFYMSNGNVLSIANTGCGKKILEILKGEDKE